MVYPQGLFTTPESGGGDGGGDSRDHQLRTGAADTMPLDSGSGSDTYMSPSWEDDFQPVSLSDHATLSEGLRAARLATGRDLDELADVTRVRRQYLEALEAGAYEKLPSRPFSTGYVRAYARALGLDEETAAERFKQESPDGAAPLRAPVGSELDDVKPKATPWIVGATVLISAVVLWNVARHSMAAPKAQASDIPISANETWSIGAPPGTPIRISAPLQAPKDQTVPEPYITPGLEEQLGVAVPAVGADGLPVQVQSAGPTVPVGAAFNPKGAIYGALPNASTVTIQARKPVLVVLRSPDGKVVNFARQLAAGEAFRAPNAGGWVVDVSDPMAVDLYFNGEYHGSLQATVTGLSQLNGQASALAARAAAAAQPVAEAPAVPAPAAPAAAPVTPGQTGR
jgi:transcriptional regulator with XRE-family HTH domain